MKITKEALQVNTATDKRFLLILSGDINAYLKWKSDQINQPKSVIVRQLLVSSMAKDKRKGNLLSDMLKAN